VLWFWDGVVGVDAGVVVGEDDAGVVVATAGVVADTDAEEALLEVVTVLAAFEPLLCGRTDRRRAGREASIVWSEMIGRGCGVASTDRGLPGSGGALAEVVVRAITNATAKATTTQTSTTGAARRPWLPVIVVIGAP
jgi:hypothetical protein